MIESGQFASVHYIGTLGNGEEFDSTEGREPFEFEIGAGMVLPSFEEAVRSMSIDEEKSIHIKAADAYGDHRADLSQTVPLTDVNQYLDPKEGMVI
ncbi:MAG TPA: FKBP-type peptidyl-prolyl cis-trans isomerase, partial [Spirochaetota bacterium]